MAIFKRKKYDKKTIKEFEQALKQQQQELEDKIKELNLREKDMAIKMPDFMANEDASIEADEVEELNNLLSLKMEWENQLERVKGSLERIEKGVYGICESCGELIEIERLRIEPSGRICMQCVKKQNSQLK